MLPPGETMILSHFSGYKVRTILAGFSAVALGGLLISKFLSKYRLKNGEVQSNIVLKSRSNMLPPGETMILSHFSGYKEECVEANPERCNSA
jgi:hypothetical protein